MCPNRKTKTKEGKTKDELVCALDKNKQVCYARHSHHTPIRCVLYCLYNPRLDVSYLLTHEFTTRIDRDFLYATLIIT